MAATYSQLEYWTRYLIGDPQGSTYSEQMYTDALNFACKDYAVKTGVTYVESTAVAPTAAGIVSIPTQYLTIKRVLFGGVLSGQTTTTPTQLVESTFNFESMKDPAWQSTTGEVKRWVLWSGNKIKLSKVPLLLYPTSIGYVEVPSVLSPLTTTAGSFVVGKSYQIETVGGTDFTLVGATSSAVGVQFIATGIGAGAGTVVDTSDLRIPDAHAEYLKYAACAWLLQIDGDGKDPQGGDKFMEMFNSLIGFADPVLGQKLATTRDHGVKEI